MEIESIRSSGPLLGRGALVELVPWDAVEFELKLCDELVLTELDVWFDGVHVANHVSEGRFAETTGEEAV